MSPTRWWGTPSTPARDSRGSRVGGVLVGAETYEQLPAGTLVEPKGGLQVKGKERAVEAYVLLALP
jgi:class 3 adenylate cyclase